MSIGGNFTRRGYMANQNTWILVANSCLAKVYRLVRFPTQIEEVTTIEFPSARLQNKDLVSSAPGRNFNRGGTRRHSYEPESDPHQLEVEKFAKQLSGFLTTSLNKGDFGRLYLFASPNFLGLLRQHMDPKIVETIIAEIPKDMPDHKKSDIEKQLAQL